MSEKRAKIAGNKLQLTVALQGTMRRIQAVERAYQATVRRKPIDHELLNATKGAVKYALGSVGGCCGILRWGGRGMSGTTRLDEIRKTHGQLKGYHGLGGPLEQFIRKDVTCLLEMHDIWKDQSEQNCRRADRLEAEVERLQGETATRQTTNHCPVCRVREEEVERLREALRQAQSRLREKTADGVAVIGEHDALRYVIDEALNGADA